MSRLTDEELRRINGTPWTGVRDTVTNGMVVAMAIELRERRAADLSAEELSLLAEIREEVGYNVDGYDEGVMRDRRVLMVAVLDRLLAWHAAERRRR